MTVLKIDANVTISVWQKSKPSYITEIKKGDNAELIITEDIVRIVIT